MYTLWCWCTPIQYDIHAYHSVMIFSYALWCILDVDDAYTVHIEMMYIWWWGCIPMMMHAYTLWRCMVISKSIAKLLYEWLCMMRCTMMYMSSVWQWNDLSVYSDDLAVIREQRLSAAISMIRFWQVHRFSLLLQGGRVVLGFTILWVKLL